MSSLVLELQREAMNPQARVTDLLRKAVVVASKLGIDDFKAWALAELTGYEKTDVPPYRKIQGELKAFNRYNGWIPVILEDAELQAKMQSRDAGQSIGELEDLYHSKGGSDTLQMPLPHDWLMRVFGHTNEFRLGMVPTLLIGRTQLLGIMDAVRNEVLKWTLELESRGVLGEGMTFSPEEVKKASTIHYNIGTFTGVLGNVSSSQVQIGDYATIHTALKNAGVPQEGRNEIENVLETLKTAEPQQKPALVKRGMEWLARYGPVIGTLSETIRGWLQSAGVA